MGFWSTAVMGGDTPLDILGCYAKLLGIEYGYEEEQWGDQYCGFLFTRELINENLALLYECSMECCHTTVIWGQVLGVLIMYYGACMPREIREHILDCIEDDPWKNEGDPERVAVMRNFGLAVESYPALGGVPVRPDFITELYDINKAKLLPPELFVH